MRHGQSLRTGRRSVNPINIVAPDVYLAFWQHAMRLGGLVAATIILELACIIVLLWRKG